MKSRTSLVYLISLLNLEAWAAQPVVLSHPIDFQSSPTTLIDFELFPNGDPLPDYGVPGLSNQWLGLGVLISDSTPDDGATRFRSTGPEIPSHSGTNAITDGPTTVGGFLQLNFVDPATLQPAFVTEAGLWIQNGYAFPFAEGSVVTLFDFNNSPIYSSPPTTSIDEFIGLRFDPGISTIRISDPHYFLVDDLQFGQVMAVPEPNTWALFVLGTLPFVARVRLPRSSHVHQRHEHRHNPIPSSGNRFFRLVKP